MKVRTFSWRSLFFVIIAALAMPLNGACDRDDDSPPVTFAAPSGQSGEEMEDSAEAVDEDDVDGPQHPADLPEGTAEQQAKLIEGRTAFLSDQFEEAEEIFKELAFEEPVTGDTISAAVALAQIYIETGRSERALELFADLEEHIAHIPEVLFVLAGVYAELGHPQRAIRAYDRTYALNRDYIFVLPQMAELLIAQGEEEKAGELLFRYEQRVYQMAEILESPDRASEKDRLYVLDILALLHDERAHDALQKALGDPSAQIRGGAALALADLAVVEARDDIEELAVEDDDQSVRDAARVALDSLRQLPDQR